MWMRRYEDVCNRTLGMTENVLPTVFVACSPQDHSHSLTRRVSCCAPFSPIRSPSTYGWSIQTARSKIPCCAAKLQWRCTRPHTRGWDGTIRQRIRLTRRRTRIEDSLERAEAGPSRGGGAGTIRQRISTRLTTVLQEHGTPCSQRCPTDNVVNEEYEHVIYSRVEICSVVANLRARSLPSTGTDQFAYISVRGEKK